MGNPDLSGKSGCEIRRNPGNHHGDIGIRPYAKLRIRIFSDIPEVIARICSNNPDLICGEIRAIATEMSEFVRMRNEEKSCFACLLLLLLNKVFEDFRMGKSGFIRMVDAKKSGQSPRGSRNLSGCEIWICPDAIYQK